MINLGDTFGRWIIISEAGRDGQNARQYLCECKCGKKKIVRGYSLKRGDSLSCGCLALEKATKHGFRYHKIYRIWLDVVQRCTNSKSTGYLSYGGRGITLYEPWLYNPSEFIDYCLHIGWKTGLQIDRVDVDGNYEPGNIRFVTHRANSSNKRVHLRRKLPIGVSKSDTKNQRFCARITIGGKKKNLGSFGTPEEASRAYIIALEAL